MSERFDIIVIGGGHAGAEAAWAAARLGADVALVTMDRRAIGRLSCNPAIGGLGKGQMVREIDALGGLMGLATDRAGIQFRMLNRSKGPAVWAPRAQADRDLYPAALQDLLATARSLTIIEGSVDELLVTPEKNIKGVLLEDGRRLSCEVAIVTTGTFMRALMHCGEEKTHGGRVGEQAAVGMSRSLEALGFELGRLKTGTPPRIHRDSIDYSVCSEQPADEIPKPFSFLTDAIHQRQISCWITWTNDAVHEHIRANLHRAPMYSGQIQSTGPRYCPSIEDKVVRFADKTRHQVFLEPEGYDSERVYCNGISTSLPRDVQDAMIRRIAGLEQAQIIQPGYAVEYDWVPTHQIRSSLETKLVSGLFLAGQINGTSGYEEAAAQGLVAGINAVQRLRAAEPMVLGRDEAYIGVMIDDLITKPQIEPYRMFTSRAEYRLFLRADNADCRLTPIGRKLGTVDDDRWRRFERRCEAVRAIEATTAQGRVDGAPLSTWLRRPEADLAGLADALARMNGLLGGRIFGVDALEQVLINAKYGGYVARQAQQIERFRRMETKRLPEGLDYGAMPGLRLEARERLAAVEPRTLGQAARITGINPADVTALWIAISAGRAKETR